MKETPEKQVRDPEAIRKTKYFSSFALAHLSEMRILRKGGVLGKENKGWRNISEHCLAEAVGADILAEHLGANRKKIVDAAIVHDWYKRHEVEAMKELGGAAGHKKTSAEDEVLLRELGVPEDIIRLAHVNIPDSIDPSYLAKRTTEEKILHYVDLITLGSDFTSYENRLTEASKDPRIVEFCDSYKDKYGGLNLLDVQWKLAAEEQLEFEKALGIESGTLAQFIKENLKERIEGDKR